MAEALPIEPLLGLWPRSPFPNYTIPIIIHRNKMLLFINNKSFFHKKSFANLSTEYLKYNSGEILKVSKGDLRTDGESLKLLYLDFEEHPYQMLTRILFAKLENQR